VANSLQSQSGGPNLDPAWGIGRFNTGTSDAVYYNERADTYRF
jgi:hypothetical protein